MKKRGTSRRGTILLLVVGLLAMLFIVVSAYITLARFDRQTVRQTEESRVRAQQLSSVAEIVRNDLRRGFTDPDGGVLGSRVTRAGATPADGGRSADFDHPGAPGGEILSAVEPVYDANTASLGFDGYVIDPSSLRNGPKINRTVRDLLIDSPNTGGGPIGVVVAAGDYEDVLFNVRLPITNADGSAIPDTRLDNVYLLTDIVNAAADRTVRTRDVNFYQIDPAGSPGAYELYERWSDQARYVATLRVVPNGGLVSLYSPTLRSAGGAFAPQNRYFQMGLFNHVVHPSDRARGAQLDVTNYGSAAVNQFFDVIAAESADIEQVLRRRGGTLAPADPAAAPTSLLNMSAQFSWSLWRNTFGGARGGPSTGALKANNWQPYNLATYFNAQNGEWGAYRQTYLIPSAFLTEGAGGASASIYPRRQLVTMESNSDLVARHLAEDKNLTTSGTARRDFGLFRGQLKFPLALIGSLRPDEGAFEPGSLLYRNGQTGTTSDRGVQIARQIVDYFYDLLSGYENNSEWGTGTTRVENIRHQAYQLAVNLISFAAPRYAAGTATPGFIDVVSATEPTSGRTYYGVAPQPYITQIVAFNPEGDPDPSVPAETNDIVLAVELHNPFDDLEAVDDTYELSLGQFALTVSRDGFDDLDPATWAAGAAGTDYAILSDYLGPRMPGRSFATLVLNDPLNRFSLATRAARVPGIRVGEDMGVVDATGTDGDRVIRVNLWRRGAAGAWHLVDRQEVRLNTATDPRQDRDRDDWVLRARRDKNVVQAFYGDGKAGAVELQRLPRWGAVFPRIEQQSSDNPPSVLPIWLAELQPSDSALPDPILDDGTQAFSPYVPFYAMNANLGERLVNGALRPNSFPTPGFMLFVARYAHSKARAIGPNQWVTMGERLVEAADRLDSAIAESTPRPRGVVARYHATNTNEYPVDLGHMPVFDNGRFTAFNANGPNGTAGDADDAYLANSKVGRIPWGLQVFDYFTTIDYGADMDGDGRPDIDPYRIPGLININAAPWYVLAGLPLINSATAIDSTSASPAFWSTDSGVLFGVDTNDFPRFDVRILADGAGATTPWPRLGARLAVAAAAYRDRIAYDSAASGATWYLRAFNRGYTPFATTTAGGALLPQIGDDTTRATANPGRVGQLSDASFAPTPDDVRSPTNPAKFGFQSVGELLMVDGWDQSASSNVPHPLAPGSAAPPALQGDYIKAVSLLALLDTHFLTVRSNTFTVYSSVFDREDPQASVRSQMTIDRSNLIPRLARDAFQRPVLKDLDGDGVGESPLIIDEPGLPQVISKREVGYFNARYDN